MWLSIYCTVSNIVDVIQSSTLIFRAYQLSCYFSVSGVWRFCSGAQALWARFWWRRWGRGARAEPEAWSRWDGVRGGPDTPRTPLYLFTSTVSSRFASCSTQEMTFPVGSATFRKSSCQRPSATSIRTTLTRRLSLSSLKAAASTGSPRKRQCKFISLPSIKNRFWTFRSLLLDRRFL